MAGSIDVSLLNTPPDKSEFAVAKYFADLGKDIVFIPPSAFFLCLNSRLNGING